MSILGICDGHDAGAALVDGDGRLRFAVSEERLTRRKHQCGFPRWSIAAALRFAQGAGLRIERVALAEEAGRLPFRALDRLYAGGEAPRRGGGRGRGPLSPGARLAARYSNSMARSATVSGAEAATSTALVRRRLAALGLRVPVVAVDHHLAHAWSAGVGVDERWSDALVLTLDAFGDGLAGTVSRRRGGTLERVAAWPAPAGPALLFGALAQHLGYAEGDEGKVVARAAGGDPERLLPLLRLARPDPDPEGAPALGLSPTAFVRAIRGEPADDVAAALQRRSEELVTALVVRARSEHGGAAVALAGGVFANVAINGAIAAALPRVPLFVAPAMGDGGLCGGAAQALSASIGVAPEPTPDARLGPGADPDRRSQGGADLDALRSVVLAGGVLARCVGPMEFGPRALGARSLLFAPDSVSRGLALNRALGRDPVMPFGPILPVEAASHYLVGWSPEVAPMTTFMTVALPATPHLRRVAPAAVHTDGTTRPQVLREEDDPALHRFLLSLDEPVLVNTSLNRHGEPIVANVEQAARAAAAAGCGGTWFDP